MNQHNVDDVIREWTDLGEERLPDRYLQAALDEIETTPQRGAWPAPLKGLIMRFQTTAPYLAVAAVVVAAVVLYGAFVWSPVGGPDASPTPPLATPESTATASPSPTPRPVAPKGTFAIDAPAGAMPSRTFDYTGQLGTSPRQDGLVAYGYFQVASGNGYSVFVYLNPDADYAGSWDTSRDDLIVEVHTQFSEADDVYISSSGECQVEFERYSASEAVGSLDCSDIPGWYLTNGTQQDGVVQLSGTFAFDPSAVDYRGGLG